MAAVLHELTGPLQLAGLFLLLVVGLARVMVRSGKWQPSPELERLLINRIFTAALLALVLGVGLSAAAPLIQHYADMSEETFHGSVATAAGEPVANALVTVRTLGSTTTNPSGEFDMVVPRDRALREYKVQVTAAGYRTPDVLTATQAQMHHLDLTLVAEPRHLVRALGPYVAVGQYYGSPALLVTLHVENTTPAMAAISEMRATVSGPGATYTLMPASLTNLGAFGPFQLVTGPFSVQPGQSLDLRVVMYTGANFNGLLQQITALPEYRAQPPCAATYNGNMQPPTEDAYRIVETFAKNRFVWKPGAWHLEVFVADSTASQSFKRDFTLSEAEVAGLLRSVALMKQCQTITLSSPFAQDGTLANFVSK